MKIINRAKEIATEMGVEFVGEYDNYDLQYLSEDVVSWVIDNVSEKGHRFMTDKAFDKISNHFIPNDFPEYVTIAIKEDAKFLLSQIVEVVETFNLGVNSSWKSEGYANCMEVKQTEKAILFRASLNITGRSYDFFFWLPKSVYAKREGNWVNISYTLFKTYPHYTNKYKEYMRDWKYGVIYGPYINWAFYKIK